jgi:hypothetical protein
MSTQKKIESLAEYIKEIIGYIKEEKDVFFRGQPQYNLKLTASVFRKRLTTIEKESELFNLARRREWKYLTHCKTELEQMVVLQHYGLKTRLLDLTSNPLVALYFACKKVKNDGEVFVFKNTNSCDEVYAKIIAKFVSLKECNTKINDRQIKCALSEFGCCDNTKEMKDKISKPIFFHSPFNNERITAQMGAFIITPFFFNKEISKKKIHQDIITEFGVKTFIIDKNLKKEILEDLKLIGIDESTIFPDLEHQLKSLNENL